MRGRQTWIVAVVMGVLLTPALALAHPNHALGTGFAAGALHPFTGWDHLLAMVAVGLWAAQLGGRARWALPLSFVSFMMVGGLLTYAGFPLPLVESGILASTFLLGLLIVACWRMPLALGMTLVALFAMLHGSAHVDEMGDSPLMTYAGGFILTTVALHVVGLALGWSLGRMQAGRWVRWTGAAISTGAALMWVGVL